MLTTLCLFSCALVAAQQPAGGAEWQIVPRLSRGEELVYRGSYSEETTGRGVQFTRTQRLEHRVFALDATPQGIDAALLTVIKDQRARTAADTGSSEPVSIRLELVRVSPRGRVTANDRSALTMPLEGAAPVESGAFVEVTRAQVASGDGWEIPESGRPARAWKVAGTEAVNGTSCIKLVGLQQSDEWDAPRGDKPAWRRRDTVWLAPNLGVALRFERVIEHREPARRDPSQRTVTEYTLENRMVYPAQLADDRRREIMLVHRFGEHVKPHLKEPEKAGQKVFDEVLARISQHMERYPATPYRPAVLQFQKRMEAARRGEAVPVAYTEEATAPAAVIALGQPAPDFVATELGKDEALRLRKLLGRPILLVFYSPASRHTTDILKFAQLIADAHRPNVTVVGLAVADDTEKVLKQRDELRLTFPLLAGQGMRHTYAVEATPKFVVLDAHGIVRGAYIGWGRELPDLVKDELARLKPKAAGAAPNEKD